MFKKAILMTLKDLRLEFKKRTMVISLFFITILLIFIPSYEMQVIHFSNPRISLILVWLVLIFNTLTVLNRSLALEVEAGCWEGILLLPLSLRVTFLGKLFYNLMLMIANALFALFLYYFFFNEAISNLLPVILVLILSMLGFIGVGLLFALMALKTEGADLVIPFTVLPMVLPMLIMAMEVSIKMVGGLDALALSKQIGSIVVYDLIFISLAFVLFKEPQE